MFIGFLRKHARLMVLLMVFALLCGLVYYIYARPVYYSKSLVGMGYFPPEMEADKHLHESRIRGVVKELQAPHLLERTARRFGIKGSARDIQQKAILKTAVQLNSDRNIEVEVWPTAPVLADQWTKILVEEYEAHRWEKHRRDKLDIEEAYSREVDEADVQMGDSLDAKTEGAEDAPAGDATEPVQQYRSFTEELQRLNRRIDEVGRVRISLEDPTLDSSAKLSIISNLENDAESAPAGIDWQELGRKQQALEKEIAEKSPTHRSGHRVMQALRKDLEAIEQTLQIGYDVARKRFDQEYVELLQRRDELRAKAPEFDAVSKQGERIKKLENVFRTSQLNWERMNADMQKKLEALEVGWEKDRVDLTFLSLLDLKTEPVAPDRINLLLACLAAGGFLAIGVPILLEGLDQTVRDVEEVESGFHLRSLGVIPRLEQSDGQALVNEEDFSGNRLLENLGVIRNNLLSAASTKAPRVVLITSALPKEGKTIVASNLAASFAQSGRKTLLIDTDLRGGRVHRLFGYRVNPGLANVLLGEVPLEVACRTTAHPNLFALSAGKHLGATDLLGSEKFTELMTTLRGRFDHIIVDTSPVLGFADVALLQRLVEGVLLVIRSSHTPARTVDAAIEMLEASGANLYGFVLNRPEVNAAVHYYQLYRQSGASQYKYGGQALGGT